MVEKIKEHFLKLEKEAIPQLSVNCVIFGFHEKMLKVVVNKIAIGRSVLEVLPGGFVGQKEDLSAAVERVVKESTGLEKILLRQFDVIGNASRSFGEEFAANADLSPQDNNALFDWFSKRFVTICYMALVDFSKIELRPTQFLETAEWLPVGKAKVLAMDHADILKSARAFLVRELPHTPVASNLLPKTFTLPELHSLLEAILGRNIDRPNFRRKVLKSNMLVKVGQDGSRNRRPADLYTFKHGKKTSLHDEYRFGF